MIGPLLIGFYFPSVLRPAQPPPCHFDLNPGTLAGPPAGHLGAGTDGHGTCAQPKQPPSRASPSGMLTCSEAIGWRICSHSCQWISFWSTGLISAPPGLQPDFIYDP